MKPSTLNLTLEPPRSPRDCSIGGYVIAARALDKCRSSLVGKLGEYHSGCFLDQIWLDFTGISYETFRDYVATAATDEEVAAWVKDKAAQRSALEITLWNNELRYKRISELPHQAQAYLEDYIPAHIPLGRQVCYWFDVYDIEEKRM